MPKSIAIFHSHFTANIAKAFKLGADKTGYNAIINPVKPIKDFDIIAFYGMSPGQPSSTHNHVDIWKKARALGKPVIILDYGYIGNREWQTGGYLKVSVNYWHPQEYFQNVKHDSIRFDKLNINVSEMKLGGKYILLAGIGPKSAVLYNIKHQQWDKKVAVELRKYTDMPILYRAKPNHAEKYSQIPDTIWTKPTTPLKELLDDAWAVVTHHSNVAIDGLIKGVPCFVNDGVSLRSGLNDLSKINAPKILTYEEQKQFLYDLSYTQWTIQEISDGYCLAHLINEKLIPKP